MKVTSFQVGIVGTNCYVVENDDKQCLIIDVAYSGVKIEEYIKENNLKPLAILLTHGHFDHCGGARYIFKDDNLPVYCHKDDIELASNASKNRWGAPSLDCDVTNVIKGEENLKIGAFEIKVLPTPGHTPGSVCYFIKDYMFSGDTLFADDIGRTDLAGGNMSEMKKSLEKIKKIEGDYKLLPGHEESSTLSREKQNNRYLK
jgi:glyoxylase-like metal-dependent hydrolase (beta-lactamase superfamily II)